MLIGSALSAIRGESQEFDRRLIHEYNAWHQCSVKGMLDNDGEDSDSRADAYRGRYIQLLAIQAELRGTRVPKIGETHYFEISHEHIE